MACRENKIPVKDSECFFVYSDTEYVAFWVDQDGEPTPLVPYDGSEMVFRSGRKTDSPILLTVIGTIEDRIDPDDDISKRAVVIPLSPADKEKLITIYEDATRDGTIYVTNSLKRTPIVKGLYTINGGA